MAEREPIPTYRTLSERSIDMAAAELNRMPVGQIRTDVLLAHAAKTQALATIAVAQALLEIGNVLRAETGGA
ncbi:hypothetical protein [Streptomyces sp. NPDC051561]|uniref:hypothetical protein n=1 Tax=Streptomyces sp. NPDC051561 TaxID=3365658 RepID=UPI00378E68C9